MSKINFKALVEALIFEAPQPPTSGGQPPRRAPRRQTNTPPTWYTKVIKHFITGSHTTDNPNAFPDPNTQLYKTISVGIKSGNIAVGSVPIAYIPILDLFRQLLSANVTGPDPEAFIKAVPKGNNTPAQTFINKFLTIPIAGYNPTHKDVINYAGKMNTAIDAASKSALETYNNKSLIEAINEMIKKRTDVVSRLSALRNPWGAPFQNFIRDLFLNPQQYASGSKKIPGDFTQIVDDLYIPTLIRIAVTAQDYYKSLNSGNFDAKGFEDFLYNRNNDASIKDIQNSQSEEAFALIQSLADIANYQRSTVGAKTRLNFASQAAGSLASAAGAKLYVGS